MDMKSHCHKALINFSAPSSDSYYAIRSTKPRGFCFSLCQGLMSWRREKLCNFCSLWQWEYKYDCKLPDQTRSLTLTFLSREYLREDENQDKHIHYFPLVLLNQMYLLFIWWYSLDVSSMNLSSLHLNFFKLSAWTFFFGRELPTAAPTTWDSTFLWVFFDAI